MKHPAMKATTMLYLWVLGNRFSIKADTSYSSIALLFLTEMIIIVDRYIPALPFCSIKYLVLLSLTTNFLYFFSGYCRDLLLHTKIHLISPFLAPLQGFVKF